MSSDRPFNIPLVPLQISLGTPHAWSKYCTLHAHGNGNFSACREMEGQVNCDENKHGSLTPVATEDDYPTPRFNPNDGEESPVASFGLAHDATGTAETHRVYNRDTCQYVLHSFFKCTCL